MIVYVRVFCLCFVFFFFSSRRRHTRCSRDWSSDVCSSDLHGIAQDRDEHEVRGPTHQGVQGSRARPDAGRRGRRPRSEEHTSELQSRLHLVCRLLLEKKKKKKDKLVITPIRKEHNILVLRHTTTHYQLN